MTALVTAMDMSHIAEKTGIGRATLYKYFGGVEAILVAWHKRQITRHLEQLAAVREQAGSPIERLEAVLEAYALICQDVRKQTRGRSEATGPSSRALATKPATRRLVVTTMAGLRSAR